MDPALGQLIAEERIDRREEFERADEKMQGTFEAKLAALEKRVATLLPMRLAVAWGLTPRTPCTMRVKSSYTKLDLSGVV